ncbi:large conductance mechanosensitive channel protein MscL [Schaalia canis]|uniref:Large-conductance mechanosensitive channel n=1 Tax=Schaalia canis TaxID=100469 RepID=A0A3P1SEU9_9ACTO|nr:large conductance mechanosensitive channel protein MscL [Schaalia canis]RRC95813.1 large conductance mechanosensitive channel protein MscL [Schaalia canis]
MLQGFKDFISRGNVIDLAVGVVIGGAFGKIVTALVENLINPLIAGLIGQPNFDSVGAFMLGDSLVEPGKLLSAVVQFLLVAAAIYFTVVVPMNKMAEIRQAKLKEDEAAAAAEEPAVSDEAKLLLEIRDLLASK